MRGVLTSLIIAAIFLVIIGVTLSVGAQVSEDLRDTYTTDSSSYNASQSNLEALSNLAQWQTTISTVIAAVIIIGLLLAGFGVFLLARGRF